MMVSVKTCICVLNWSYSTCSHCLMMMTMMMAKKRKNYYFYFIIFFKVVKRASAQMKQTLVSNSARSPRVPQPMVTPISIPNNTLDYIWSSLPCMGNGGYGGTTWSWLSAYAMHFSPQRLLVRVCTMVSMFQSSSLNSFKICWENRREKEHTSPFLWRKQNNISYSDWRLGVPHCFVDVRSSCLLPILSMRSF